MKTAMNSAARVVTISQPEPWIGCRTIEELIAYIARVSNPKNQDNHETGAGLVDYLMTEQHWSPFEMVHVAIEVRTTRDIGRQVLRHHSLRFQEFSQRYAAIDGDDMVLRQCRFQDNKNRQKSVHIDPSNMEHRQIEDWFLSEQELHCNEALARYHTALSKGIAKEQARTFLPEGNTPTHMYISGFLRDWIFYCRTRLGNGTQEEHQWLAQDCAAVLLDRVPALSELIG